MLYQPSNPDLNSLSDTLEKYPRRRVLLFKVMEEIMRNLSPFNKQTRQLLVTACNQNPPNQQSAQFSTGINCN